MQIREEVRKVREDVCMRIMAVGAHVDDIEGMMGGTLALMGKNGIEMFPLITFSHREGKIFKGRSHKVIRKEEAHRSLSHVNLRPTILDHLCGDLACAGSISNQAFEIMEEFKPDAVFTHWPADLHGDHIMTAAGIKDACWRFDCREVIWCETAPDMFGSKKRAYGDPLEVVGGPAPRSLNFHPTHWVDISRVVHIKEKMLREMESQEGDRLWKEHVAKWAVREKRFKHIFQSSYIETFTRMHPDDSLHPKLADLLWPISEPINAWWPR